MPKEVKEKSEIAIDMDAASKLAAEELKSVKTAEEVAQWFKNHYLKAGYKRLSRELMAFFKVK